MEIPDDGASLSVRLGNGSWEGYECQPLLDEEVYEEVFPVASPGFARTLGEPCDSASLVGQTLIDDDPPYLPTMRWRDYFQALGVDYADDGTALRLASYDLVVPAAISGQGLALGWTGYVDALLELGLLVPAGYPRLRTGRTFYLLWLAGVPLSSNANRVRDRMIDGAKASRRPPLALGEC